MSNPRFVISSLAGVVVLTPLSFSHTAYRLDGSSRIYRPDADVAPTPFRSKRAREQQGRASDSARHTKDHRVQSEPSRTERENDHDHHPVVFGSRDRVG